MDDYERVAVDKYFQKKVIFSDDFHIEILTAITIRDSLSPLHEKLMPNLPINQYHSMIITVPTFISLSASLA